MSATSGVYWLGRNLLCNIPGAVINAKAPPYNAKGDGIADDTAALEAAFAAAFISTGGRMPLYLPAGTYKVKSSLIMRNIQQGYMFGAGRLLTTIKYAGGVPTSTAVATASPGSPGGILNMPNNFVGGEVIAFTYPGDPPIHLPTPLGRGVPYYVRNPTSTTFNVSLTHTGPLINFSDVGSGGPFALYLALIHTHGCQQCTWEGVTLDISGKGTAGLSVTQADDVGLGGDGFCTTNMYADILFKNSTYGLLLGASGFAGSENTVIDCYFQDIIQNGVGQGNYNSLGTSIINSNFLNVGTWLASAARVNDGGEALGFFPTFIFLSGNTFTNCGMLDGYDTFADGNVVLDTHSTNSNPLGGVSNTQPMSFYTGGYTFHQGCSFSAPNAPGHTINMFGADAIVLNGSYPDGKFASSGGTKLVLKGTLASTDYSRCGGAVLTTSPFVDNITPLNIPVAIPDFGS